MDWLDGNKDRLQAFQEVSFPRIVGADPLLLDRSPDFSSARKESVTVAISSSGKMTVERQDDHRQLTRPD